VVDNNSNDRSVEIIKNKQNTFPELILVQENREGYGLAYLKGFSVATGSYIFMADADNSYDFLEINKFIASLKSGSDLVVGNRFAGKMVREAMPWLHRYLGNPFLSFLVKLLFKVKINDIHCGARAISKEALAKITLYTGGMEFASEMIIKASRQRLAISEVPISYRPRLGYSKLHSLTDGWRHLRFILLYSPLFLFLLPGLILFFSGLIATLIFYFFSPKIFGIQLYVHPLFFFSVMIILGYQLIIFSGFSKIYAITHLGDSHSLLESFFKRLTIEKAGFLGIAMALTGVIIYGNIFFNWVDSGFSSLNEIKNSIIALTCSILGVQTFFSAFMLSILGIKEK
jgi:glycosyltransferase involved in cell wall biosynthesis